LLTRIDEHFAKSGQRRRQRFENPKAAQQVLRKVIQKLNGLWRRKRPDKQQPLLKIRAKGYYRFTNKRGEKKIVQRQQKVMHLFPQQIVVPQPVVFARGFLRQAVDLGKADRTYTYEQGPFGREVRVNDFLPRKSDVFLSGHKVIVHKLDNRRFDVVDDYLQFPIVSNITRQRLLKVVELTGELPDTNKVLRGECS